MLEIASLVIGAVTTSLIVLTVSVKNSRSLTNKLFIGLAVGLVGWSIANYFSLHTSSDMQTLQRIRFVMLFVVIQNTFFFFLASVFPDYKNSLFKQKRYKIAAVFAVVTALLTVSPFLFVDFKEGAPVPGPGMAFFLPHALLFAVGGLIILILRYKRSKGVKKVQLQYFLAGSILLFTLVPIGNFIVPIVFKNNKMVSISPLYSIIFSGLIAYAIVKKKLFDIKSAITRSVAYVLSIGTIVGLFSLSTIGIANYVFRGESQENIRSAISILLAGVLAISFQSLKRFFNKFTGKLFYKNAYDTQEVLDSLGNTLVAEIDLRKILASTRKILTDAMNSSFIEFVLLRDGKPSLDLPDENGARIGGINLIEHISDDHDDMLITEELPVGNSLHRSFSNENISVVLRLKTHTQIVGYIFLGEKLSGEIYGSQDIKLLSIITNELAVAIQNALRFEEIEKFNITLQQKVDKATAELRKTNQKLIDLDEAKDEFISMASHQLRTPLTSMKGYVSMVLEGDAGKISTMQKKLLDQAFVSSQRMVYLIADLLNVSRLKTGKFIIESKPTDLAKVVEEEIGQLVETAKGRNLELKYDKPKEFPMLMLDETKIRQVIMNFADNAIYYTPAGGHIKVNLADKKDTIEFTVVDDGLGVPKAEQHHLFNKFYRAGNAKKARPDGTGLGLFMAKKVIVAQGGAIIFSSTEGKGSTFGFSFAKAKLKPTAEQLKSPQTTISTTVSMDAAETGTETVSPKQ